MVNKPTAIVYVDGLNLYHQKLKYHPHTKWLNLLALAEMLIPSHEIKLVRYFTSKVLPGVSDPQAPKRQLEYWRALNTLDGKVSIHEGRMEASNRYYLAVPRTYDSSGNAVKSKVKKTEEKGSDVALASHMVKDAAIGAADLLVIVSTDSDFKPAIRLIQGDLGVRVGFLSAHEKPSAAIQGCSPLFTKVIRRAALEACVFPDSLNDSKGPIYKPSSWTAS